MIHPYAVVSDDSHVDSTATVWQFASVIRGADIAGEVSVGAGAVVDMSIVSNSVRIGHGAQIHPGMWIEHNVFIGPGAILCNDRFPSPEHGGGFDLSSYRNRPCIIVDPGAAIGAAAVVLPGVRIGGGAVVAAHATVENDVPPDHILHRDGSLEPIGRKRRARHGFAPDIERMMKL